MLGRNRPGTTRPGSVGESGVALPVLSTGIVTDRTDTSVIGHGYIVSGEPISSHGVCWKKGADPVNLLGADGSTNEGAGVAGYFSSAVSGLDVKSLYYFRAYATNLGGTAYGSAVSRKTLPNWKDQNKKWGTFDLNFWAAINKEVVDIAHSNLSDPSPPVEIVVVGDTVPPSAPTLSLDPSVGGIQINLVQPTTDSTGGVCNDFDVFCVYHSTSPGIDPSNPATYDDVIVTRSTRHVFSCDGLVYFAATAKDTSGNESVVSTEASSYSGDPETVLVNLVPNPFFQVDANGDGIPDQWTAAAEWVRSTDSYYGNYSMKGQGSAKLLVSDKVTLPWSNRGLIISGMAKSSGTSFAIAELANVAPAAAPQAHCDASGDLVAIVRLSGADEVIDLYDVSNPASPTPVGTVAETGEHRSWPFKIYGDYLICGQSGANHLYIYDISNPASPSEIMDYSLANAEGRLAALAVRDWHVFACCDDDTNGGFIETINITTPASAIQSDLLEDVSIPTADFRGAMAGNAVLAVTVDDTKDDWLSPTGHSDPNSGWVNESNAYDESTDNAAQSASIPTGTWSEYLILVPGQPFTSDRLRFHAVQYGTDVIDIDVYDGASWIDVYSGTYSHSTWTTKTFSEQIVTQARVRFMYNGAGSAPMFLNEFDFYPTSHRVALYNITDLEAIALYGRYAQEGLKEIVLNGSYAYLTCDSGTDANKIVVLDVSTPAAIAYETAVGGAGADNYTGTDALFISNGYLVNVGVGSDAAKYSVSFWDISAPALPVIEAVGYVLVGDLDAAAPTGGFIFGPDVDNTKLRIVTPAIAGDWTLIINFYDAADNLIDSLSVYVGNADVPFTGTEWTAFSVFVPEADIPNGATQIEFVCQCDETSGYVYVDALSAVFDTE